MNLSEDRLYQRLRELGIKTSTVEHPAAFTVEQSKSHRGSIEGGHTKNLLLADKAGRLFLVVALETTAIGLKRLHLRLGCGRLSFAKADILMQRLGIAPGSVTPFALINDVDSAVNVVLDDGLMREATLNFHPLRNTATTSIARDDFLKFLRACGHEPRIAELGVPEAHQGFDSHG